MTRLPVVFDDDETWGDVLNTFLEVAHNADGTLKTVPVIVNVKTFGAVGDGSTACGSAFQNAIDACTAAGGGIVYVPPGDYKIDQVLVLTAGVYIQGAGAGVSKLQQGIWPSTGSSGFVGFITAAGTYTDVDVTGGALTVDAAPGDTTLTLNATASLATDHYYLLGADRAYGNAVASTSHDERRYAGEFIQVDSVTSGTAVALKGYVNDFYAVANAASLKDITFVRGIGLRDLTLYNPDVGSTFSSHVTLVACADIRIENCIFDGCDGAGVNLDLCREFLIRGVSMRHFTDNTANNQFGYGVNFVRATENGVLADSTFEKMRHACTTNGIDFKRGVPRNIVISGCTADYMTNANFDTHAQGADITFIGCSARNNPNYSGFQIRSQGTRVIACSVDYCQGGMAFGLEADGGSMVGNVIRNIVRDTSSGYGIQVTGARHVMIHGNFIENTERHGIFIQNASDYVRITKNTIWNPGCRGTVSSGINLDSATAKVGAQIHDNTICSMSVASDEPFGTGSMGYGVSLGTLVTGSYVSGNKVFGATTGIYLDLGSTNTFRQNSYIDNTPLTLEAISNAADQELLKFNTDRAWSFWQRGATTTASLDLRASTAGKDFTVTNKDAEVVTRFHAGDAGSANNAVSFCEDRFYINDDGSLSLGSSTGPRIVTGAGSPETVVTAPVGSIYLRNNGGAATTLYVKESGVGNTGWIAK